MTNNSVLVICDNVDNYKLAKHLFALSHHNCIHVSMMSRIESILNICANAPAQYPAFKGQVFSLDNIKDAHKYLLNFFKDHYKVPELYPVHDMDQESVRQSMAYKPSSGYKPFVVNIVLDGVYSKEVIKVVKSHKIYFYDRQFTESDVIPDKMDYCSLESDSFHLVENSRSTSNVSTIIEQIYKNEFKFDII